MNTSEKQGLKQRLLALQTELQSMLEDSAASGETVELDQAQQGRLSRMDAMQGQAMAQAAHARTAARLQSIERTFKLMEDNNYGDCVECGEPIPFDRLMIDPTLRYCVGCAEMSGG